MKGTSRVVGINHLDRSATTILMGAVVHCPKHRQQLPNVDCVTHVGSHDGVHRVVDRRLGVVARVESATGALHVAAGRFGVVVLCLRPGQAELALVTPALGIAALIPPLAFVVVAATTLDGGIDRAAAAAGGLREWS